MKRLLSLAPLSTGLLHLGVAHAQSTVVIEGQREQAEAISSLDKLTEVLLNVPQTVTAINRQELEDRAITTMNDALRTVPGITLGPGETSWQGTNLILRGFTTRNDMFRDGMRDYGYYYRDPFNDESIEVLKGPASILFGRGSTGGVIEQASKRATIQSHRSATAQFGTDATRRGTLDFGTALPRLGDGAALRVNAMLHDSEVADRDEANSFRWGVAPSLALGLGTPTRLTASYFHQTDDSLADYGIPWFAGRPADVRRSNYYGFEDDYINTRVDMATVRFEHDFNETVSIRSQVRYSRAFREFRTSEPTIPAGTPVTTSPSAITISRLVFEGYSTDTFAQGQTDVTLRFESGSVAHTLVTGIELGREEPKPAYLFTGGLPTTNLADPVTQPFSAALRYVRLTAQTRTNNFGAYALDTLKFGERWQLVLGARWDHFDTHYQSVGYSTVGAVSANTDVERTDAAPSYRAALIYKPRPEGTLYLGYANSFNPSAEGIESLVSAGRSVAQANLSLDPEKSRTYDLGSKWALAGGALTVSGSVFRIEKTNARIPNPSTPGFNALGGNQRVDGLELELVGRINPVWSLRAGYTFLDGEVTASAPGGPLVGAPLTLTPENTATVWSSFDLTDRFSFGIGALSVSSRLGQNTAAAYLTAPGFVTLEAMGRYKLSGKLQLQANIQNLTDKYYYDQLHPFHIVPGAGRSAQLSVHWNY